MALRARQSGRLTLPNGLSRLQVGAPAAGFERSASYGELACSNILYGFPAFPDEPPAMSDDVPAIGDELTVIWRGNPANRRGA